MIWHGKKYWKKCPNPIYLVLEIVCTHNPGVVFTATPGLRDFIFLYELVQATWRYLRFIAHKKKTKKKSRFCGQIHDWKNQLRLCTTPELCLPLRLVDGILSSYYELVQTKMTVPVLHRPQKKNKKADSADKSTTGRTSTSDFCTFRNFAITPASSLIPKSTTMRPTLWNSRYSSVAKRRQFSCPLGTATLSLKLENMVPGRWICSSTEVVVKYFAYCSVDEQ